MDALIILALTLILITALAFSRKVPVFITLLMSALFFGLLAGFDPDTVIKWAIAGMGRVFSGFAIIILSGIVIVRLLSDQNLLSAMMYGINRRIKNPCISAGILGYLLSVPTTCCITTYMMLAPALKGTDNVISGADNSGSDINSGNQKRSNTLLYTLATGSIISYVFIFPTPVTIPLFVAFAPEFPAFSFDLLAIPVSVISLLVLIGVFCRRYKSEEWGDAARNKDDNEPDGEIALKTQLRAWAPFLTFLLTIPAGLFILKLSHATLMQFIMLMAMITALILAPDEKRKKSFSEGAKFAGLILFDFCAAGAIGSVISESGLANSAFDSMLPVMPAIVIPFLTAAMLATAQGSRVVTAVISAEIIGKSALADIIHPVPLILMIIAGTCCISYLTDPYFWLVKKTTGDDIGTVLKNYTLPLACYGIVIFVIALIMWAFVFPQPPFT
ncbi:GntP family permease [Methanoplanus endosymbiosus]|uniref:GntP family permease n=1 Tax=Methanoplanus endosymbiosus TaxID=33865 RepID=A0A9E7TL73_9EURY|nr:GntP family permease [Methanoplanus endosymbiosus]UUX93420.1 GntP family permease [Methanoplanus endosymbiosus]